MIAMGSVKGGEYMFSFQVPELPHSVRIREVGPRDGFQNEPEVIATADKVRLIDALVRTGLRRIEVTSFVRADVIPQLADADEVLARIDAPADVSVSVLIPNERGLQNALVDQRSAFRRSTSSCRRRRPTTARTSTARSASRSSAWSACSAHAREEGLRCEARHLGRLRLPLRGPRRARARARYRRRSSPRRRQEVGFGDTTGMANPLQVRAFFEQARAVLGDDVELTAHFHNTRGQGLANVLAALEVGIDSFESLLRRAGRLPGAGRAPPATSPPRTSSRCCTRWASRPASTSTRCSRPRAPPATSSAARWAATRWWPAPWTGTAAP